MSLWLEKTIELINKSRIDIKSVKYNSIIVVFYDHLSNRNLAILIASLYNIDENDIYFEIDKIISNKTEYDVEEIDGINKLLNQNHFNEWIESDEF